MNIKTLSTIIPAYNEENKTLKIPIKLIGLQPTNNIQKEIIIVNDCSRDKTVEDGISYYGRTYNKGKKINTKDAFRAIWCISKYGILRIN